MSEQKHSVNRREFLGQLGMGIAVMSTMASSRVLGANDRLRIGLIGAGDRGQQDLKDALRQPNVECVAIADVYSRRGDQVKQYVPGVTVYNDPMKLLERKDIDAVINATPLHLHAKYFLAALAAGKDLYSEKTMTWDIPEAVACKEAAAKSKQVVQIGLQHESSGELADARQWISQGIVGKITMVDSWMSRNSPHGHGQWMRPIPPDCNPAHVNWNLFLANRPKTAFDANKFINWRLFWEFSGGNITENMVHQISWIISALNLDLPIAAEMMGGVFSEKDGRQVPDTISVNLEYPDLIVSWRSTFSNGHYGLGEHFLGSDGTIEHLSGSTDMVTGKYRSGIAYYPEKANRPTAVMIEGHNPGVNHMANWMECIRTRKQPNATVEIGYQSAVAAHMANLAYHRKGRVTLHEAMSAPMSAYM
ncbi:Gfo/Idh/MocA family protein [Acidipila rosea]|uniref:Putative dehydrogenase n=1 Tax=Acidipila rosea TaxID=768535 RepID=A0A4R1L9V0_9BACT|nr:Gfo/Idh/MocA family oxidoreductase [Acidipila rosea]MBW4043750.1 Gfo/Idh/MocA family oxidoreductase [Acidobacteriota bacterium]TCK74050.1 putative dehydrogenase [Acidipila rosea]